MRLPPRPVVAVSLAVAATLPGDALLYAVLPVVWQQLGLELWMVGVLLSANRFVRLATNPLAGVVVARTGMRAPFIAAVFATVAVSAAYGLNAGFLAFLAARWLFSGLDGSEKGSGNGARGPFALEFIHDRFSAVDGRTCFGTFHCASWMGARRTSKLSAGLRLCDRSS